MKTFYLALDLKDDDNLIKEYEAYHKQVWPEIVNSIKASGIQQMELYRVKNRLFMVMHADDDFSFEEKSRSDAGNQRVQEWENLMWKYQQQIPGSIPGEKWRLLKRIFKLI